MLVLIVVNNYSRSGNKTSVEYLVEKLKSKFSIVNYFIGNKKNSIKSYLKSRGTIYDLICIVGGDGTIHEVVNAVADFEVKPVLAIIPAGTCNDLAHTLGIPKNIEEAVNIIIENYTVSLPIFKVNNTYFIYAMAIGLLTDVSYKALKEDKKRLGKLAYYLEAIKSITNGKDIAIDTYDESKSYSFILCLNSHYLAGFRIRYKNNRYINDNNMKLILIRKSNRFIELADLGCYFLFGEYCKHNITTQTVTSVLLKTNIPVVINADGEKIEKSKYIDISTTNNSISFIANKNIINKIIK